MDKLEKANEYIRSNRVAKEEVPVFHVSPLCGWINDPNGFSVYRNKIHLFYQHHPYSEVWGPMHWGHCVTEDFIKWEDMPVALAPDQDYDAEGCFSGSGIEVPEGHLLVYTGVREEEHNGVKSNYQNQCLAIGNGVTYTKNEHNPVITGDMLPENFSRIDFRDPKIWKEADGYYMVIGNKTIDGVPQVVLFHSDNMHEWHYVSVLAKDKEGNLGIMWECPDFFFLDGEYVLIASPQDICANEELHNGNNAVYFLGKYDRNQHVFDYQHVYSLDDGLDFYAPQTMETEDGRRIMIGWMQSWDNPMYPDSQRFSGMMTIPRELSMKGGRICQLPVHELENYRSNVTRYNNVCIHEETELKGISGRSIDLQIALKGNEYGKFRMKLAADERHYSEVIYDRDEKTLTFDRTHSGFKKDAISTRSMYVSEKKDVINLRILVDRFSVEIFVNDGEQVMTSLIYTPVDASGISFASNGKTYLDVTKYDIEA